MYDNILKWKIPRIALHYVIFRTFQGKMTNVVLNLYHLFIYLPD